MQSYYFLVEHCVRTWKDLLTIKYTQCYVLTAKTCSSTIYEARHEKTDLKVFVVVIPKEGWAHMAAPILLLV